MKKKEVERERKVKKKGEVLERERVELIGGCGRFLIFVLLC